MIWLSDNVSDRGKKRGRLVGTNSRLKQAPLEVKIPRPRQKPGPRRTHPHRST